MDYISITIIIILIIGVLLGLKNGLIKEVAGLIGLITALFCAKFFVGPFTAFFNSVFNNEYQWNYFIAWLVCFLAIVLIFKIAAVLITKLLEFISLGFVNKLLGAVFGVVKYIFLLSIVFNILGFVEEYTDLPAREERNNSVLYNKIKDIAPLYKEFLPEDGEFLKKGRSTIEV